MIILEAERLQLTVLSVPTSFNSTTLFDFVSVWTLTYTASVFFVENEMIFVQIVFKYCNQVT